MFFVNLHGETATFLLGSRGLISLFPYKSYHCTLSLLLFATTAAFLSYLLQTKDCPVSTISDRPKMASGRLSSGGGGGGYGSISHSDGSNTVEFQQPASTTVSFFLKCPSSYD